MQAEPSEQTVELDALNPPQAEAVAHVDGPLIVFAGAGSGKTRVITYRIANLVAAHSVPPYRILAVTFTNKAAGEMRSRLERILGDTITRELWIGTFHAICVRLIRRYHEAIGVARNFVIYDDSDQKAVMKRVMADLDLDERRIAPQKLLGRIMREKQEGRGPSEVEVNDYFDQIMSRCFGVYQERLRAANAVDFADLLLIVLKFVERENDESAQHLCSRFSHVLVDEFQDVNLVQYRLVHALSGTRQNICVVGDDDQSIYRWRGADVRNIRNFTRDYPDAKLVKLEQNYRSSGHVVGSALGVIRLAAYRQPKELWTANDEGEPVRIVHTANERDEAAWVVDRVKEHIATGTAPQEIAIFYRVHAQSRVLEEVIRNENVPYQIIGGTKFFDRAEVKDVLAYLRVISNPQSDVDLLRIINKPPRKIGNKTIQRLVEMAKTERCSLYDAIVPLCGSDVVGKAAKRSLRQVDELLQSFMRASTTASPRELTDELLAATGYTAWLERQDTAEADARMENIGELLGSLAEYEDEMAYADETPTLHDYLTRVSLLSDADTIEEVARVPMMTVHAAKGLEFDVVFMTGLEEGLFPLRGQQPGEEEELEEERRLAYVAITRARLHLALTHTNTRMIYGQVRYNQPSRFLDEVPPRHQQRAATKALHELSHSYTYGRAPTWRETIRGRARSAGARRQPASSGLPRRRPVERPAMERQPGERFVDRSAEHNQQADFDDSDGFDAATLRVGSRVRHPKFGAGTVKDIGGGPDPAVTVSFPGWGVKKIKLRYLSPG